MTLQYRDASPWDVLLKPSTAQAQSVTMKTAGGRVTQDAVLFALRSMGRATPTQICNELGVPVAEVSDALRAMCRLGYLERDPVLAKGRRDRRATFEYWITPKEASKCQPQLKKL